MNDVAWTPSSEEINRAVSRAAALLQYEIGFIAKTAARPIVGWNPALERVSNGRI